MSNFKAKKAYGQNFLTDPFIREQIVDICGAGPKDTVVEIGPGKGALTVGLSQKAGQVIAVELDSEVIPLLKGNLAGASNVTVCNEDILKFDWSRVEAAGSQNSTEEGRVFGGDRGGVLRIVGNLPYYITTPILLGLLENRVPAENITVMVQKEVAERIVVPPGGKDYGVLSVSLQYYCDCEYVLDVPADCFSPRPKVDSAVIRFTLKKKRLLESREDEDRFFSLMKTAFSQRRKTLLNSLTGFGGKTKEQAAEALESCGIDPARRPETLSYGEFADLTMAFGKGRS